MALALTEKAVRTINEILSRGNTVEVRVRKDKIVVLEITGKVKCEVTSVGK